MENEEIQNVEQVEQTEQVEVTETIEPARKKLHINWYWLTCGICTLCILVAAVATIMIVARDAKVKVESVPVVTTESTTEVTSVPETVETIPVTEPVTEPTVEETEPVKETEPTSKPVSASKSEEKKSNGELTELEMLAIVIYQEAGGSKHCDECRRRVADVVLNRVASKHYPNTIEKVLTQKSQYGKLHWKGIVWPSRAKNKYEKKSVERAWRIAEEVMNGQHSDVYGKGYVYQAEFKQGKSGFWCCGHYFGKR